MGLSSKQVSSDHGLDWNQTLLQEQNLQLPKPAIGKRQQQPNHQQLEPLKCPRCDSTNTKFCYYNNYNKSQPRHFCKACKRHWTKGGTLRNVPVGGGRKNKRLKTSKNSPKTTTIPPSTTTTATNIINKVSPNMIIQAHQVQKHQNLSFSIGDRKNTSEVLCQGLINPLSSSVLQQNSIGSNNFTSKSFNSGNMFMSSSSGFPQGLMSTFPYSNSTSCSFDTIPSSISGSFQSPNPNVYNNNYNNKETMEDSIITTIMPTTSSSNISQNLHEQPWKIPNVSTRAMDFTTNYWNWDDIDSFVSSNELNLTWDDSEIKP